MECYECGNDSMTPRQVGAQLIYECDFCSALEGDAAAVSEVFLAQVAGQRGVDPTVFPLVEVLEKLPGLKVREASGGSVEDRIPPYLFFHFEASGSALRQIEHMLQSLEMSHRRTHKVWTLEAHYMNGELRFALRPRFMKLVQDLDPDEIAEAREDLRLLAERFDRDRALSWWS